MLDELLLLRLWAASDAGRGEVRSRVAADLRPLAGDLSTGTAGWQNLLALTVEHLASEGYLTMGGRGGSRLLLTEAGRARAREVFKIDKAASDPVSGGRVRSWIWWRDHHALPLALGGNGVENADELRIALLRRFFLPDWPSGPAHESLKKMVDLLLAKRLKVSRATPSAFRQAVLREWAAPAPTPPPDASDAETKPSGRLPDALPAFAQQVLLAAQGSPTGRFGDKVFVSHVWRGLLAARQAAPEQQDEFKGGLIRANTEGLLRLSRADLTGAHDARDVRDSKIHYLGETFHFVRLD